MSFRTYATTAIDCDTCDECYSDVVPVSGDIAERFAIRDGWQRVELPSGIVRHLCPCCAKKLDATID